MSQCKLRHNGYIFRTDVEKDRYCLINDPVYGSERVIRLESFEVNEETKSIHIIGKPYMVEEDFFDFPCKSRDVGIFMCYNLSRNFLTLSVQHIVGKLYPMKLENNKMVFAKLLHQ